MEPTEQVDTTTAPSPATAPDGQPWRRPLLRTWVYGTDGAAAAILGLPVAGVTYFVSIANFYDHPFYSPASASMMSLGLAGMVGGPPTLLVAGTLGRDIARTAGKDPGIRDLSIAWTLYGVSLTGWSAVALGVMREDVVLLSGGFGAAMVGHIALIPFGISQLHRNRAAGESLGPPLRNVQVPKVEVHLTPWVSASRPGATLAVRW
jgi:hypothetical protein